MSSSSGKKKKAVVQFSDSSSSSDSDGDGAHDMAREMALAAKKLREKNPHAEQGRAAMPRSNPLERRPPTKAGTAAAASSSSSYSTGRKVDLFADSDDDASDSEEDAKTAAKQEKVLKGASTPADEAPERRKGKERDVPVAASGKGGGDDDDDVDGESGLHINKSYAAKFEEVKRKQELQRLTEKYGKELESVKKSLKRKTRAATSARSKGDEGENSESDDDDDSDDGSNSSSSSNGEPEDDDAVLLTKENELAFARALLAVRKAAAKAGGKGEQKDKAQDDKDDEDDEAYLKQRYFPPVEEQIKRNNDAYERALESKEMAKKKKKFTLKEEYQRAVRSTAAAGTTDAEDDEDGQDNGSGLRKLKPQSAEERALRRAFLDSVADSTDAFSVTKKEEPRGKTNAEEEGESAEAREARQLEEQRRKLLEEAFQKGSKADEDEVFIRQFFLKDLWRGGGSDDDDDDEEDGGTNTYARTLAELAQAEEDEAFYNDADVWEREYQEKKYRHEEEAEAARIQTFPRPIGAAAAGLLRKTSDTRKDARRRRKERLEAARLQQVEELKRLKHLKRQEIEEQRALIAAVAGMTSSNKDQQKKSITGDDGEGGKPSCSEGDEDEDEALKKLKAIWSDKDLEAPFDPQEFDAKMAQLFNEDYYAPDKVNEDEVAYMEAELDGGGGNDSSSDDEDDDGDGDDDGNSSSNDNDGAEEEEKVGEGEGSGKAAKPDSRGRRKAAARAKFAALAEEPELFQANSLEEAKALQRAASATTTSSSKRRKVDEEGLFLADPFDPKKEDSGNSSLARDGKAAREADTAKQSVGGDDDLALLYPSASLHHLEESAFQHRQELDRLLAEHKQLNASTSTSGASGKTEGVNTPKGEGDGDDDSEDAVLKRLQADLKRKEEEYYELHHEGTISGGKRRTRFRYREVEPEDFTLSIEEILTRDDRQLNMIAPMNCYSAYLDKEANLRDRQRIERRRMKGFREIESDRTSRRYGEVKKTALLDPVEMTAEDGAEITQRLRKRLREEGVEEEGGHKREDHGGQGGRQPFPRGHDNSAGYHANRNTGPSFRGRGRGGRGGAFPRGGTAVGGGRGGSHTLHGNGRGGGRGGFNGGRGGGRGGVSFSPRGRGH